MNPRIVVVTGSRDWLWPEMIEEVLQKEPPDVVFFTGGSGEADRTVELYCQRRGLPYGSIMANWPRFKLAAGPIRNGWLLNLEPRKVIAFRYGGLKSKGTSDCIKQAKDRGIPVEVYEK